MNMTMPTLFSTSRTLMMMMAFAGCLAEATDDPTVDESSSELVQPAAVVLPGSAPTLVASLKLPGGHVVEFHDFGTAALIVEAGAAYTAPVLDSADPISADQLAG